MQNAFLIIIVLLGSFYALINKKGRIASGLLIMAIAFVLQIPGLTTGFWSDILSALSLIVFAVGIYFAVSNKKFKIEENNILEKTNDETKK